MKRLFVMAIYAIAPACLVGCSTDATEDAVPDAAAKRIELSITASSYSDETRTSIGEKNEMNKYPVYWDEGDDLAVVEYAESKAGEAAHAAMTKLYEDKKTADFSVSLDELSDSPNVRLNAYYPYSSLETESYGYCLRVPAEQTARAGSADANASLMWATYQWDPSYGEHISFKFDHLVAYVKMTIKNLPSVGDEVKSVKFKAYKNIVGRFECYRDQCDPRPESEEVTVDVSALGYDGSSDFDVWFAVLPTDDIKDFEVSVYTDNASYTRYVNEDATGRVLNFGCGVVSRFTFDMSSAYERASDMVLQKEREALIALYNATDGKNWKNNENWLSDKPVGEWRGVGCHGVSGRVNTLSLYENNLVGEIPDEIGCLAHLQHLDLHSNQINSVPYAELAKLQNLEWVHLGDNLLTGTIPAELLRLSKLESLTLHNNKFEGEIPKEIGNLTNLTNLWLQDNNLTGSIPAELGKLDKLVYLHLSGNQLSGEIPPELGNMSSLYQLYAYNNKLTGTLPAELGKLDKLVYLYLSDNQLSGEIPPELGNMSSLYQLYVGDNDLTGSIPAELGKLDKLEQLILSNNKLSGTLPPELGNLSSLRQLYAYNNNLTGTLPAELGKLVNLKDIHLGNNDFSGIIPEELNNIGKWNTYWWPTLNGNNFNLIDSHLYVPAFEVKDTDGDTIKTTDEFAKNGYTLIVQMSNGDDIDELKKFYEKYVPQKVGVIVFAADQESIDRLLQAGTPWRNVHHTEDNSIVGEYEYEKYYPGVQGDIAVVADNNGKIVYYGNVGSVSGFLDMQLGSSSPELGDKDLGDLFY